MLENLIKRFIKTKLDDCTLEYYFILRIIFRHINSNEKNLSNFVNPPLPKGRGFLTSNF